MINRLKHLRLIWAAILGLVLLSISLVAAYTGLYSSGKENFFMTLNITSLSFAHNGEIPLRHTCDGMNTSPEIKWAGLPSDTKSLALIVDDPDAPDPSAPKMTWVHWLLYNIPATSTGLIDGATDKDFPAGTLHGLNDWKSSNYGGPCPPIGKHRYFFKLYALDSVLPDLKNPTKAILVKAMQGHVLAQTSLVGLYQRHAGH